ncbi:hypothetical protein [Kitasatospora sp. MMS16-BH015]|uniref:hypothetical protein n=1 Tax=Kitasatospora sp. MMS16-BH015 TaxID=2018025 RepID=UPI000CF20AC0|nr:hypothetical protein [Kitasatospora sp. MMS16-BH015]
MSGENPDERNPFAPPPEDAPEQPWRPRTPVPPQQQGGPQQRWQPQQQPPQPRFDPNDPVQRRARYALSAGMAGLFCLVTGIVYVSLLFGALALYWGVSALRAPRPKDAPTGPPAPVRPQTPAAIGGLVTGGAAVLCVLLVLGTNLYYRDYVTCVSDSLTAEAQQGCSDLGPKFLVDLYGSDQG